MEVMAIISALRLPPAPGLLGGCWAGGREIRVWGAAPRGVHAHGSALPQFPPGTCPQGDGLRPLGLGHGLGAVQGEELHPGGGGQVVGWGRHPPGLHPPYPPQHQAHL